MSAEMEAQRYKEYLEKKIADAMITFIETVTENTKEDSGRARAAYIASVGSASNLDPTTIPVDQLEAFKRQGMEEIRNAKLEDGPRIVVNRLPYIYKAQNTGAVESAIQEAESEFNDE